MKGARILAAALTATTLFATAVPAALADEHHDHEDRYGQQGQHGHDDEDGWERQHAWHEHFGDLSESAWAQLDIEKAYQLGLMLGEGEGHFKPNARMPREQAVATAVRLMGLNDAALAAANSPVHFADGRTIDGWAKGYVAVATDKHILPAMGDGDLRPHEAASRLWVSVLLVKALGYDAEAQSKMKATLPFEDSGDVPADLVGYVAAAADHKLVAGYEDNTFRPDRPVTRAEMAALLGRGDGQFGDQGKREGQIKGTVQAVDTQAGTLTLKGANGAVTSSLANDAAIFVDGKPAKLSDLKQGMALWVKLNANMQITLVDAKSDSTGTNPGNQQGQTITGTVTSVTLPQGATLGIISVQPATGAAVTAPVAPMATLTGPTGTISLNNVHVGDSVQEQLVAGIVTQLTVTTATPAPTPNPGALTGKVMFFAAPSANGTGTLVLLTDSTATAASYSVAATATVTQNGAAKAFGDVKQNAHVQLTVDSASGAVTQIQLLA